MKLQHPRPRFDLLADAAVSWLESEELKFSRVEVPLERPRRRKRTETISRGTLRDKGQGYELTANEDMHRLGGAIIGHSLSVEYSGDTKDSSVSVSLRWEGARPPQLQYTLASLGKDAWFDPAEIDTVADAWDLYNNLAVPLGKVVDLRQASQLA